MPSDRPDTVCVVAASEEQALAAAQVLAQGGLDAVSSTDLALTLRDAPAAVLIDPRGWEGTCRAILTGYADRKAAPPAVFFLGEEETVLYGAGPAAGFLKFPLDVRAALAQIERALAQRRAFEHNWPRLLRLHRLAELSRVEDILTSRTGMEIRADRHEAFVTAVGERMVATLSPSIRDYERLLASSGDSREVLLLSCLLVVGETCFWRYSGQMYALENLLRRRGQGRGPENPLKIWAAGCSTGEEPYSVAMAARNALGPDAAVEIWGTDISPVALAAARRGRYSSRSVRNLPPEMLVKWMEADGTSFRIKPLLKQCVHFETQNLFGAELPAWIQRHGPFDAIFLRNVAIYFGRKKADLVIEKMIGALAPGGGLFLGSAETLTPPPPRLEVVHEPGAFYYVRRDEVIDEALPVEAVRKLAGLDPEALAAFREGLDHLGREDFAQAEAVFSGLLAADSAGPLGHTGIAVLLANQGREVEAREHLDTATQSALAPVETYFLLGLLHERAARPQEALAAYDKALERDPRFVMAHFNRAWIYKRLDRERDFRSEMRRALGLLKVSPHCPAWVRGGLSFEAIAALMADALDENEAQ